METNKQIIADFVKLYNRENKVFYGEGKERYLAPPIERWINGMIEDGRKSERTKTLKLIEKSFTIIGVTGGTTGEEHRDDIQCMAIELPEWDKLIKRIKEGN